MISSQLTFAHPISVQTYTKTNETQTHRQKKFTDTKMKQRDR